MSLVKKRQEGLPLAISTPQWRFLNEDTTLKESKISSKKKGLNDAKDKEGMTQEDASEAVQATSPSGSLLDSLCEELADETVSKEDIIAMLEEAVHEAEQESVFFDSVRQANASSRWSESHSRSHSEHEARGPPSGVAGPHGSPPSGRANLKVRTSPSSASSHLQQYQQASGSGSGTGTGTGTGTEQVVQDASQFIKNPRYMRQIREVARRTSLGTIQGLSVKRNRNYREPKKVPAMFTDREKIAEEDYWSDEDSLHLLNGEESSPSVSPIRSGSPKKSSPMQGSPKHHHGHNRKEKEVLRPQSPVIIWRPNAAVRLASDLPRECLNKSILNPQQDMKLTDLIKSDRGFDPSLLKSQGSMPAEMKKTFSYYKQFVSNMMPSADEEKEVLRSKTRPEWGKRIPPSPKSEYGAWYIPPELWESDMRLSTKNKEKKIQHLRASLGGTHLWNSIFDERSSGEPGLTELEIQEAQVSEQIPNQYSSKMYKEYIKKKNGRLPHYLDRVL